MIYMHLLNSRIRGEQYRDGKQQGSCVRHEGGSASAFASLYQEYYLDLYRFALYTLKNRQDAEDVVGDTVADALGADWQPEEGGVI